MTGADIFSLLFLGFAAGIGVYGAADWIGWRIARKARPMVYARPSSLPRVRR